MILTPHMFGAQGDGAHDDTSAIQSAISALEGIQKGGLGGILYFPRGVYRVTSSLTCEGGIVFRGDGMYSSVLKGTMTDGSPLLIFTKNDGNEILQHITIEDLGFEGNPQSGKGLYFDNPYHIFLNRCWIYNCGGAGVEFFENGEKSNVYQNQTNIRDCFIQHNYGGGIIYGSGNQAYVQGCLINQNGKAGIYAKQMNQLLVLNNEFAGYYDGAILGVGYPIVLNGGNLITIQDNAFENNEDYNIRTGYNGSADTTNTTRNLTIRNNDFKPVQDNHDLTHIRLHYAYVITIQGNHFEASQSYSGVFTAIEMGTLNNPPELLTINNEWDSALDTEVLGSYPYLSIEHGAVTSHNTP